tara:strand:- start:313 stop:819 length:507 start_codon:yes stop_codon:yes gene_type:complete
MEMIRMPKNDDVNAEPVVMTDEATAFLERVEAQKSDRPQMRVVTDRFDAEMGHYYNNLAIVRTPNYDIPSQKGYNDSTAVTLARLDDGRRLTWWVSNTFEQERLKKSVDAAIGNGASFPLEIEFVRHKKMSKAGNEYNVLSLQITNTGEAVEVPPVPEDQLQEVVAEE